ncbi:hypothetical protein IE81DRAFT_352769, partial [Ceraceosorus guamensis]
SIPDWLLRAYWHGSFLRPVPKSSAVFQAHCQSMIGHCDLRPSAVVVIILTSPFFRARLFRLPHSPILSCTKAIHRDPAKMPPKKRPLTPLTDEELSEDDPLTKGKTTSERHPSMQQDTEQGQAFVPSPAPSEAEAKPATPKKKSRSATASPATPRKDVGWSEAETIKALLILFASDGVPSVTKTKKTAIANALGRSEAAVENWFHKRIKRQILEINTKADVAATESGPKI